MTDKELLTLAAKAAGFTHAICYEADADEEESHAYCRIAKGTYWRPLTDDGDALRLAVLLKIDTIHYDDYVVGRFDGGYIGTGKIMYEGDPYAATRRALVRAAASMGKALP